MVGMLFYKGHWRAVEVVVSHRVNCIVRFMDDCTEARVNKSRVVL